MGLGNWFLLICVIVNLFVSASWCFEHVIDGRSLVEEEVPEDTGEVIMKEDAEEIFYNVDLEKYDGIECPKPTPPENGVIVGSSTSVGSVVYVECKEGFYLHGPTVMSCVPVGSYAQWDPIVSRICVEKGTHFDEIQSSLPELPPGVEVQEEDKSEPQSVEGGPMFMDSRARARSIMDTKFEEGFFHRQLGDDERPNRMDKLPLEEPPRMFKFCLEPPVTGPCKAYFQRYYFDKSAMECRKFIYGGCHGNENNFETIEDCMTVCSVPEEE